MESKIEEIIDKTKKISKAAKEVLTSETAIDIYTMIVMLVPAIFMGIVIWRDKK